MHGISVASSDQHQAWIRIYRIHFAAEIMRVTWAFSSCAHFTWKFTWMKSADFRAQASHVANVFDARYTLQASSAVMPSAWEASSSVRKENSRFYQASLEHLYGLEWKFRRKNTRIGFSPRSQHVQFAKPHALLDHRLATVESTA